MNITITPSIFIIIVMLWVISMIRRKIVLGLRYSIDSQFGGKIRCSNLGYAIINGDSISGVRVEEYQNGWLLRLSWILGGGMLWLPRSNIMIGELEQGRFFFSPSRKIISGANMIILRGKLTDTISKST